MMHTRRSRRRGCDTECWRRSWVPPGRPDPEGPGYQGAKAACAAWDGAACPSRSLQREGLPRPNALQRVFVFSGAEFIRHRATRRSAVNTSTFIRVGLRRREGRLRGLIRNLHESFRFVILSAAKDLALHEGI